MLRAAPQYPTLPVALCRVQCSDCIETWASVSKNPSCPLCRKEVERPATPAARMFTLPEPGTARARDLEEHVERQAVRALAAASTDLDPEAVRDGLRLRMEAEHQRRQEARVRRLEFERRMESYIEFTPSGRSYDDLPLITLSDVKKLDHCNRKNIGGALRNVAASSFLAG